MCGFLCVVTRPPIQIRGNVAQTNSTARRCGQGLSCWTAVVVMVITSPVFVVVDQAISATALLTTAVSSINIAVGRQATASVPR